MVSGSIHTADTQAGNAQTDLTTAYNTAAGLSYPLANDLTGKVLGVDILTLTPGVYHFSSSAQLTGTLTLSGAGDFVFQIGSTLTTASGSSVLLVNGASSCEVYWQVGTSATLGTSTNFMGNILADASITLNTGATVTGSLLARAAVTLDTNNVNITQYVSQSPFPLPESALGALTAVGVCFAALGIVKMKGARHYKR